MKKRKLVFFLAMSIGLIFILGDVSALFAQEMAAEEFTLEEITVTAQKREENQQKVPIAMEVISGDDIKEVGRNDIDEILENISSVLIQAAEDGLRVSVRGISNDNSPFRGIQASPPTVAVNKDGVYSNRNTGNQGLYDIERVEALFGPQSTLYASASPGGIVNIVTADPKTDKFQVSGTLEYGNYNLLHTEGSLNAPLGNKFALRAAFSTSKHDGYLSNGSMDEDTKSGRIKALFQPSDKFSFVLTGELTKAGGQGFASVKAFVNQDDDTYPDGTELTDPWTSQAGNAGLGVDRVQKKITGHMDTDIGIGTLSLIPSYSTNTSESSGTQTQAGMGPEGPGSGPVETTKSTMEASGNEKGVEARMASSADSSIEWILGGNAYKSLDERESTSENLTNPNEADRYGFTSNLQEIRSVYGNVTYPVTDRFRATGGLRKNWDENTTKNIEVPGKGGVERTEEGSIMEYSSLNYKVGVQYDLSENSMFYGDISTSYRMNGSGVTPGGVKLSPEEVLAYSVGAKNRFFGNKLQLNVSAYYYDYENYFANMPPGRFPEDTNGDGIWQPDTETNFPEAVNIMLGDAHVYGFDLQSSTIITNKDKLDFSVSYIKKYFTDLVFDWSDFINNNFGLEDVDYSGMDMPQAPNWNLSAGYSHNFPLWTGASLRADFTIRYTSKTCLNWMAKTVNFQAENIGTREDPIYTGAYTSSITDTSETRWQEAYHIEDFSLVYASSGGKWTLSAYINNITNYAIKKFLDGMGNMMIGNPRTYGGVLTVRF